MMVDWVHTTKQGEVMNNVSLIGNLGKEPEITYKESGLCIAKFSLAYNRVEKGEKTTDWFEVVAFGKTAETVANYVTKGKQVGVTGTLRQEKWVDRESGGNRSKVVVICDRLTLLGSKQSADDQPSGEGDTGFNSAPTAGKVPVTSVAGKAARPSVEPDYDNMPF